MKYETKPRVCQIPNTRNAINFDQQKAMFIYRLYTSFHRVLFRLQRGINLLFIIICFVALRSACWQPRSNAMNEILRDAVKRLPCCHAR